MDREFTAKVVQEAIVLQNMVDGSRRNGSRSQWWAFTDGAVRRGIFIDGDSMEKIFHRNNFQSVIESEKEDGSDAGSTHIASTGAGIKDSVLHYSLKLDLVKHVWSILENIDN